MDNQIIQNVPIYNIDNTVNIGDISISKNHFTIGKINPSSKIASNVKHVIIPAMIDLKAYLGEPGDDLAETIATAAKAASQGGFVAAAMHSNEQKVIKNKEDILFLLNKSKEHGFNFLPIGAYIDIKNKAMQNVFEMHTAGAVGFANPNFTSLESGIMQRIQQYIANFDGLTFTHCYDAGFTVNAQVAETAFNTQLGLNGAPEMSEYLMVERDINIAAYNCAKLHISGVSTANSIALIKNAKKMGLPITCDVSIFSLAFLDTDLANFDSNLKLFPFLRTKTDQKALLAGLKDGVIDAISSFHQPKIIEQKQCEFDFAHYGAISWQTFIPMALKNVINEIGWQKFVQVTCINPSKILEINLPTKSLLIDTEAEWDFNKYSNLSLSSNSPLFNQTLIGKIIATKN